MATIARIFGGLLALAGGLGVFMVDIYALYYIAATHGLGWAVLTFLIPPAWAIAPFIVSFGMGLAFVALAGAAVLGATIVEAQE